MKGSRYCLNNLSTKKGKIIPNAINTKLDQYKFDLDDRCFVGAALNADKLIVTGDSDFFEAQVLKYFKELGLEIFQVKKAKDEESRKR